MSSDEAPLWKEAIQEELKNMSENNVWKVATKPLSSGKKALPVK